MFHPVRHRPFAIAIQGTVTTRQYLDEEMAALHEGLKKTFPARWWPQPSDGDRVLVTVSSDAGGQGLPVGQEQASADGRTGHPARTQGWRPPAASSLPAQDRDGLEILATTPPKGYKEGQRLPTLVHIHGGPHVRGRQLGPHVHDRRA